MLPKRDLRRCGSNRRVRQDLLHQYLLERAHAARTDDERVVMCTRYGETLHNIGRVIHEAYEICERLLIVVDHVDEDEYAHRQSNLVGVQKGNPAFDGTNLLKFVHATPKC